MKCIANVILGFLLLGCNGGPKHLENAHNEEPEEETHSGHNHGSANEFMHRSSVDDLIKRFESEERDEYQRPQEVLGYLGDIQNQTIVDIGAGSGYFSVKLAQKGAKVIAADVEDGFLEHIQQRIDKNQLKSIELRKIPYDAPGIAAAEVDKVFLVNTYHHIENRPEYFKKARRGTKEGGELIIIDFFKVETPIGPPIDHKIAMDEVVNELKMAGYDSFHINVDLLPYQYIIKAK